MKNVTNMLDFMARELKRKLDRARTQDEHKAAIDYITDYNRMASESDTHEFKYLDMDGKEI